MKSKHKKKKKKKALTKTLPHSNFETGLKDSFFIELILYYRKYARFIGILDK